MLRVEDMLLNIKNALELTFINELDERLNNKEIITGIAKLHSEITEELKK